MRNVPIWRLLMIGVVAAVLALLPFQLSGYHQTLAARVALYFVAILGLNILTGYTGQISIGHGAFMAIGGYTTVLLSVHQQLNLILTLPVSFAVAFAAGILVGIPALRLSGVYLALATFALAVSVPQFPLKFSNFLGGSNGLRTVDTPSYLWLYGVAWACAAISLLLAWLLLRGRIGRAFRAVRDSEVAAASSGVALPIYKTFAFGISAAYAGVAGSLLVLVTNGYVQPGLFGILLSLQILIGAAVAGLGSLYGVLLGALFIALLPTVAADVPVIGSTHGQDVVFGLSVIVIMILLPNGVIGLLRRLERPFKIPIKPDSKTS
jgi:branched-chain amino acid transport system permease protein